MALNSNFISVENRLRSLLLKYFCSACRPDWFIALLSYACRMAGYWVGDWWIMDDEANYRASGFFTGWQQCVFLPFHQRREFSTHLMRSTSRIAFAHRESSARGFTLIRSCILWISIRAPIRYFDHAYRRFLSVIIAFIAEASVLNVSVLMIRVVRLRIFSDYPPRKVQSHAGMAGRGLACLPMFQGTLF